MVRIRIIATGGTIAKTYDEADGSLRFTRPMIEHLVSELRLPDLEITYHHLLSKDSLDLTDADRRLILDTVLEAVAHFDALLIVHGTDTLTITGELLCSTLQPPRFPVILTGAMRPYEFRDSDALQNVTEALMACRLMPAGIYVAMHNRVLRFPGVIKDRQALTFSKPSSSAPACRTEAQSAPAAHRD